MSQTKIRIRVLARLPAALLGGGLFLCLAAASPHTVMTPWHYRLRFFWLPVKRTVVHAKLAHFQIKRCHDVSDKFASERIAGFVA